MTHHVLEQDGRYGSLFLPARRYGRGHKTHAPQLLQAVGHALTHRLLGREESSGPVVWRSACRAESWQKCMGREGGREVGGVMEGKSRIIYHTHNL